MTANFLGGYVAGFKFGSCIASDPQPCNIKPAFILAGPNSELNQPAGLALGP